MHNAVFPRPYFLFYEVFNVKLMTEVQHLDSYCGDKLVGYVQNVVWHYLAKIINALLAVYVTPEPLNIQY